MIGELFPKYQSGTKCTRVLNNSNIMAAMGRDAVLYTDTLLYYANGL